MGSNVEIVMSSTNRGKVFIDGVEQKHVRSVRFEASVSKASVLHLEIVADKTTITGPDVKLDDSGRHAVIVNILGKLAQITNSAKRVFKHGL